MRYSAIAQRYRITGPVKEPQNPKTPDLESNNLNVEKFKTFVPARTPEIGEIRDTKHPEPSVHSIKIRQSYNTKF